MDSTGLGKCQVQWKFREGLPKKISTILSAKMVPTHLLTSNESFGAYAMA